MAQVDTQEVTFVQGGVAVRDAAATFQSDHIEAGTC